MSFTLQDYTRLYGEAKALKHFETRYPVNYEVFVENVNLCLDVALLEAQRAAQYLYDSDEDTITTMLVISLRGQGLDAEHDSDSGGHVDVFIQDINKRYTWAAEAKIDTDWPWIEGGIPQLMNRYADGTSGRDQGGFLLYIKTENASQRISDWRDRVKKKYSGKRGYQEIDCPTRGPYAFYSECTYTKTGQPFRIRHVGITLFRKASKASADARNTVRDRERADRALFASLSKDAALDAASCVSNLEALAGGRVPDAELQMAIVNIRLAADKIQKASVVASIGGSKATRSKSGR